MQTPTSIGRLLGADSDAVPWLDLIRLRFKNPALEEKFREVHTERSTPIVRISLLLGILLVASFAILDLWIVGENLEMVYVIRFTIVCPTLLALYLLTFSPQYPRLMQPAIMAAMLVVGLGVVAMTAIIDAPGNYLYYAGILDTVIYCCCIMRLRFYYAIFVATVLLITYQLSALLINPVPNWALVNNTYFMLTAIGVGAFAAYVQEFYLRQAHYKETLLIEEMNRSGELLVKATAASQAKSDFLAMVSHELRTPLNAILGFSEIMRQETFGPIGDERYRAYLDDVHSSGSLLLDLINDILDLSKAEAGRLELNEEYVNVRQVAQTVVRLMRDNASLRQVKLSFHAPDTVPIVKADRALVTRVLMNLVSNAVKFTDAGGHVDVAVHSCPDEGLVIEVIDTGIGIAPDDLHKIMEPFVQADTSLSRSHQGTGLGLPLTKKIMELHGGSLDVDSQLGVGTKVAARFARDRVIGPELSEAAA